MPASFSLDETASFRLPVIFPRPGREDAEINFTVNHRKLSEISTLDKELRAEIADAHDNDFDNMVERRAIAQANYIYGIAVSWDVPQPFTVETIALLCDMYPAAFQCFANAYGREMMGMREKS